MSEKVLTKNGLAELARFTEDGGCVVVYRVGEDYAERKYTECYSKAKGSARLRRVPPSLTTPPRQASVVLTTSDATRKAIIDHFKVLCPTSPHQRDVMRRRRGPFVIEERNAHIMSAPEETVYEEFLKAHPDIKICLAQYKEEMPWHRKKAYRETCLDRVDLNFDWARQALKVAVGILAPLLLASIDDAEGGAEAEAPPPNLLLQKLATLAATTSKSTFASTLVSPCSKCLGDETAEACLDGKCGACGFGQFWSRGLRPMVLATNSHTNTESVGLEVSTLWEEHMSWDEVKSGDDEGDKNLRHTVTGTVTEFFDAFEDICKSWVPHRYHAVQAREAEIECDRQITPAKLRNNSDWSENGEIVLKLQMQSEYWSIKYFSLLISITSFLVASAWKDRQGALDAKIEVTVQPADAPPNSLNYAAGSYYAVVQEGSALVGPDVMYVVKRPDSTTEHVPRHCLRQRLWHHIAFLGVTNEKQHVATTTQAFFTRQLEFWRLWNDEGRDAAHAFAAHDRASPTSPTAAADAAAPVNATPVNASPTPTDVDAPTDAAPALTDAPIDPDASYIAAANAAAADAAANAAPPPSTAAISAAAIALADPKFGKFLAELDSERFTAWLGHADNASHFKSSNNLYW